jgi:septal ring factor EnvC (AmiA/AmiB activator)
MKLNEATSVTTDLKSIIATIAAVALSVWAYFSITERLNQLENADQLQQQDLLAASEQRPVDQEQFMLLEFTAKQLEKHQEQLDQNVHTGVMLKQFEKEIEKLKHDVEKLKDAQREIKFSNGNSH